MSNPQIGTFALGTASHSYLEFDLLPGSDASALAAKVPSLREPRTTVGGVNLVVGFRPELWRAWAPDDAPADVGGVQRRRRRRGRVCDAGHAARRTRPLTGAYYFIPSANSLRR